MIRPYTESDLESVASLFTDSVHHLAGEHYDAFQLAAWAPRPPDLNSWVARLASVETVVLETDRGLAGFISYESDGHIDLLYTSPMESRRGVASALYRHAEAVMGSRGIRELFTEASVVARPFFARFGFEVTEDQYVQRCAVTLRRYAMRKSLVAQQALGGDSRKPARASS